jgi:CHAT domain-containing protein
LLRGDTKAAREHCAAALATQLKAADRLLPTLAEAEGLAFLQNTMGARNLLLSALRPAAGQSAAEAYRAVWSTRGLLTHALADRARLAALSPEARPVAERLRDTRAMVARLVLQVLPPGQAESRRRRLAELTAEKEALERRLADLSAPFARDRRGRADFAETAARLPPGVALLDLVRTVAHEPVRGEPRTRSHYDAFVLRHGGPAGYRLDWVPLGPAEPIEDAVRSWRKLLTPRPQPDASRPDLALRRLVWEPVERHLADCHCVLVLPEGALTGVPWAALPGREPDTYLIERHAFGLLSHGSQLLEDGTKGWPDRRLLVVGGVDYGPRPQRGPAWGYLRQSLAEAEKVAGLWDGESTFMRGAEADEAAVVAALAKARCVHLCTHGFFADARFRSALGAADPAPATAAPGRAFTSDRNPLALSGIVLAGGNRRATAEDLPAAGRGQGMLTAEAVVGLDLGRVDLVVLSACQTGLGEVAGGEGVFGLQRAFHLAGARTVVASLWEVPDEARLFPTFYDHLWKQGRPPLESLRRAQLTILRQDAVARLPLMQRTWYWAAWALSGDPGDLHTMAVAGNDAPPESPPGLGAAAGSLEPVLSRDPVPWPEGNTSVIPSPEPSPGRSPWVVGAWTAGIILGLAAVARKTLPLSRP